MIRRLKKNDVEAYRNLRLAGLKEKPQYFGASIKDEEKTTDKIYLDGFGIGNKIFFVLGKFVGRELVGVIGFRRFTLGNVNHKAALWGMYVTPDHRKKGYGADLVAAYLERARKINGLEVIQLAVESKNRFAQRLYGKYGFKRFAKEMEGLKVDGKYFDEIWMKVKITAGKK